MSSNELQRCCGNQARDVSEMHQDIDSQTSSSSSERQLVSHSNQKTHNLATSATNKDSFLSQTLESKQKAGESSSLVNPAPFKELPPSPALEHKDKAGGSPSIVNPAPFKEFPPSPALEHKEKAGGSPSIVKPAPFKQFSLSPSELPLTKEKLSESVSLEEACGFLPYLMKAKRVDLMGKENDLDQISVELQKALGDAKNICILLENAPKDVPENINDARVQAEKLMYLLSSSSRIFEKLERLGKSLKESIQVYSKQTGDYHSSIDIVLEYIMENILDKCKQMKKNFK